MRKFTTTCLVPAVTALALSSCSLYQLPDTGPNDDAVFAAAQQVILDRFPNSAPLRRSNLIVAKSAMAMDGASKSMMQITVQIQRSYTGAWEPQVRVVKHIEVGEPVLSADPQGLYPGRANPIATHHWKPLTNMPVLESRLRDEILKAIAAVA